MSGTGGEASFTSDSKAGISHVSTNSIPDYPGSMDISKPPPAPRIKGQRVLKPVRFDEEIFDLVCEWENCSYSTRISRDFSQHVSDHIPVFELDSIDSNSYEDFKPGQVLSVWVACKWVGCCFKSLMSTDLKRHLFLHAYHTRLKCIGSNTSARCNLNTCTGNDAHRNILPDLSDDLRCAWDACSARFVNIQDYYDHIRYHCEDERINGNRVPCRWAGCSSTKANVTKLKDHMRSHTQEKLLACPACGSLFSNRTRYFDHCRRQILVGMDAQLYTCESCRKCFPTARLLREHTRAHINKYPCPECDLACASPSTLSHHMKYKHTKERPYKCPLCPYMAKLPGDIAKHGVVHDNVMHQCEEPGCSYSSKSLVNLQNHIDKVHNSMKDSKYACHLCENKYFKGAYLSKHLITVHNLRWPPGHSRFRYRLWEDGLLRLNTYEGHDYPNSTTTLEVTDIDIKHHVQLS